MNQARDIATILVVDDKPSNIKLLFDALKGTGYRALAAVDGESAIRQAELAHPDLILMDVMMSGLNGFDACRRLKENPATRSIPVIFMTALADTANKLKGFEAGGVDYLTKPLQHEEALARIDAHLSRHRLWADVELYSDILLAMGATLSLDEAWSALSCLVGTSRDLTGLVLWLDGTDTPNRIAGFSDGAFSPSGSFADMAGIEPLLQHAFTGREQVTAPDETSWHPIPPWAKALGLRAHILTPVICQGEPLGVLGAFFGEPVNFALAERQRWHHILAHSLGNAVFQARSMDDIRLLSEQLQQENEGLRAEVSASVAKDEIIGTSPVLHRVLDQIELVAPTDAAVMILGESGTGKELLAQRIHERSSRRESPIIRVNCAAIPRDLFESEFFGHTRGAFTGAVKDRAGRFEVAHGGTLFLDEVGEIPMELQGKLLRVLQEGSFERVGEEKTRTSDVRIIAATNRDLTQSIADGRFREDLYYRLSVFPLTLPPLRERREDIPLLVRRFVALTARKMGMSVPEIIDEAMGPYLAYDWPGNIRELQNEIERAMILSRGLPPRLIAPATAPSKGKPRPDSKTHIIPETDWQAMQRENLLRALKKTGWRVDGPGAAAELLDLRPTTLRSRMKALGISRPV